MPLCTPAAFDKRYKAAYTRLSSSLGREELKRKRAKPPSPKAVDCRRCFLVPLDCWGSMHKHFCFTAGNLLYLSGCLLQLSPKVSSNWVFISSSLTHLHIAVNGPLLWNPFSPVTLRILAHGTCCKTHWARNYSLWPRICYFVHFYLFEVASVYFNEAGLTRSFYL